MSSRNPLPPPVVPLFPAALEQRIKALLATRLGREGTDEELAAYRQGLWVIARLLAHAIERTRTHAQPHPPCPVPSSTPANQRNLTTGKSKASTRSCIGRSPAALS